MHPKQVPIIIALSMIIVICAIASAFTLASEIYVTGACVLVMLIIASVMLGAYLPAPYSKSLTDVHVAIESLTQAIVALEEKQGMGEYDPLSVGQQYTNIAQRLAKIEQSFQDPSADLIATLNEHQEVVKRVAKILLQRTDAQSPPKPVPSASSASSPASPQTSMSK